LVAARRTSIEFHFLVSWLPNSGLNLRVERAGLQRSAQVKRLHMIRFFCGILAVAMMACGAANAGESPTFEVRKRDSVGELSVVQIPFRSQPEVNGTVLLTFQAPESGTYVFIYTSGPDKGKVAKIISVEKPGPVTTEVRTRAQKDSGE
jgi:hypothetical protein